MKICFPFIAQPHQTFHALPIALELSRRHDDAEVHIAAAAPAHLLLLRRIARLYYPDAHPVIEPLALPILVRRRLARRAQAIAPKLLALLYNIRYFSSFDALVVPERTTLILKHILKKPRFIWTRHGAGDRASGFEKEISQFDFVLMAGGKIEQRLQDEHVISAGHYTTGVYAKFDLVQRMPHPRPFSNGRPTILYNPHFRQSLSSWPVWGLDVLKFFASHSRYNLVFAPHIRLFYPPRRDKCAAFKPYEGIDHMRIDLGSLAAADMTYTLGADLYLGDVSSQVAEFLTRPRPCLFLNAHKIDWQGDEDFRFWTLGPVIDDIADLEAGLDEAFRTHDVYRDRQAAYIRDTFGSLDGPTAPKGADAIMAYLRSEIPPSAAIAPRIGHSAPSSPAQASDRR